MAAAVPAIDLDTIVKLYGSYTKLAKRLGLRLSTVHGWKLRNSIPPWRVREIMVAANEDGIILPRRRRRKRAS